MLAKDMNISLEQAEYEMEARSAYHRARQVDTRSKIVEGAIQRYAILAGRKLRAGTAAGKDSGKMVARSAQANGLEVGSAVTSSADQYA